MRFSSNLISALAPALLTAEPELRDSQIEIPSALLPSLRVPFPVLFPQTIGLVAAFSVDLDQGITQTNAAATNTPLATLQPGIWAIQGNVEFETNWTNGNPLAVDLSLRLRQGAANDNFLAVTAARNQFFNRVLNERIYALTQATVLGIFVGASGVGQTNTIHATMHCEKLA